MTKKLIKDVYITPLKQINDERGGVFHIMKKDSKNFYGFGEAYISKINYDIIMHNYFYNSFKRFQYIVFIFIG